MSLDIGKTPEASFFATTFSSESEIFIDKLSERLSLERMGVELVDALIQKIGNRQTFIPIAQLKRIREEEVEHIQSVNQMIFSLGGEPETQASWTLNNRVAAADLLQTILSPKTSLTQSVKALLTAELADNAGWEFLIDLATDLQRSDLQKTFSFIRRREQEHLTIVKDILKTLTRQDLEGRVQ